MTTANLGRHRVALLLAAVLALGVLAGSPHAQRAAFVVNTDDDYREDHCDASHCTLREAIHAANGVRGGAQIRFALPTFQHRIVLRRALPSLRHDVTLDGASQPGAECPLPAVHVDGSAIESATPVNGLEVRGHRNRLRGLVVSGFSGHGVLVDGNENQLQCLFVGVDPTGTEARGNGLHGIAVFGGHSNRVGGPTVADANLLSANGGAGLHIRDALNTYLAHNGIGVDLLGRPRLPNGNAELHWMDPTPDAPTIADPLAIAARLRAAEVRIAQIAAQQAAALEDSRLIEKYIRLVATDGAGGRPPADGAELMAALADRPALRAAFMAELTAVLAAARHEAAVQIDRLSRAVRQVLPAFGTTRPDPAAGQFDVLDQALAVYAPGEIVTSGTPSQIVAVAADGAPPTVNALSWHSLMTYGPTHFDYPSYFTWSLKPYPDATAPFPGSSIFSYSCANNADLPVAPACHWPIAYDLLPFSAQLLWQSATLTPQQLAAIVAGDGYVLELWVNGLKLSSGPPPTIWPSGSLDPFNTPANQGFYAASLPGGPAPKVCPPNRNCLATIVLVENKLANVPQPWNFEIKVSKFEPLAMPITLGIDESGNQIVATHTKVLIAQATRTVLANPDTGGQKWFNAAMYPTFKHPRCVDCHSFGTIEKLLSHPPHGTATNVHLQPSLYVPGAHVIACSHCHELALYKPTGGAQFSEVEWVVPYQDLDVNWAQKNASQICARVKTNLPTWGLRFQHFHGDSRLHWAVASGSVPPGAKFNELPTAPPHDYDEFLRRFDIWNNFGAPCP